MALDLTTSSGILKDAYAPKIREQLNNKVFLLSQLEKPDNVDVELGEDGAEAVIGLHVQRSSGIKNLADGGTLPTPGNQKYTKQRVPLRTITARIRFTVQVMEAMSTDAGAWERAATSETKRITNDMRRDVNRQLAGDGTGTIATAATSGASTTITMTPSSYVQLEQLEVGMVIDISTAATPGAADLASARTINSINRTAKTMVISGAAVATTSGDRIERSGNGGALGGTTQKEFTGLKAIVAASGTLFSVDPSVYPVWASYSATTVGNPTENVFEKAIHGVDRAGDGQLKLWLVEHGVARAYSNQLTTLKRTTNTLDLKGGYKGLSVSAGTSETAMVADRDIDAGYAFGIDPEHMFVKQWTPLTWLEDGGGTVLRQTPDQLAYEGTAYWIADLLTDARNSHAVLSGITTA